jgi:hypothetical protein
VAARAEATAIAGGCLAGNLEKLLPMFKAFLKLLASFLELP